MNIEFEAKVSAIRALIADPSNWQPWRCAAANEDLKSLQAAFTATADLQKELEAKQKALDLYQNPFKDPDMEWREDYGWLHRDTLAAIDGDLALLRAELAEARGDSTMLCWLLLNNKCSTTVANSAGGIKTVNFTSRADVAAAMGSAAIDAARRGE